MSDGKLRDYYWRLFTFLAERIEFLDTRRSAFQFPGENEVENTGALNASIVFRDGSRLFVRASLDERAEILEYDYAYIYYDRRGKRVLQYDDAPHHPDVSTHPHHLHRGEKPKHGTERVYPIDVPRVDFIAVVEMIIERLRKTA